MMEFSEPGIPNEYLEAFNKRIIDKTDEWYFKDKSYVTNSMLSYLKKGPEHLAHYIKYGSEKSKALDIGSALHCGILEPEEYTNRFYTFDETKIIEKIGGARPKSTNRYKEWLEDEKFKANGRIMISKEENDMACTINRKIYSNPLLRELLTKARKELIIKDNYQGINRKIKTDAIRPLDYLLDVKSTKDPIEKFKRNFNYLGYGRQMAYYKNIANVDRVWVIVVSKIEPYSIALLEVSDQTLEEGYDQYMPLLDQYKQLFLSNLDQDKSFSGYLHRGIV